MTVSKTGAPWKVDLQSPDWPGRRTCEGIAVHDLPWQHLLPADLQHGEQVATRTVSRRGRPGRLAVVFHRYGAAEDGLREARRYPPPAILRVGGAPRFMALNMVLAGQARHTSGQLLQPGSIFLIQAARHEMLQVFEAEEGFFDCSLVFGGELYHLVSEWGIWPQEDRVWQAEPRSGLLLAYRDAYQAICNHAVSEASALRRCLALSERVLAQAEDEATGDEFAARACRLLREQPWPHYHMRQAATDLGMSYEYFRKQFRKAVGMAPAAYQLRERMNLACEWLSHHGVQATADRLGYSDVAFFSRQFKQVMGQSPRHFM